MSWERLLVDDLAHVLSHQPQGLSCNELRTRLGRRRADVLAALRRDERFVHEGQTRASRWRLKTSVDGDGIGTEREAIGVPWAGLDPSGIPLVGRRAERGS
jgi:hypothetical protein